MRSLVNLLFSVFSISPNVDIKFYEVSGGVPQLLLTVFLKLTRRIHALIVLLLTKGL